ncbi:MAG: helix-turn-helix transcriptional regulator [Gammaproteobacteria bacterium]|nr:helix-turn-helix transcriptional regulator [Gammaproteobacteria bacterium]
MDPQYVTSAPRVAAELGRRLAQLRLAGNVTQKTLARETGIGLRTLRRLEAGQPTSLDSFLRTALALGDALLAALPSHGIRPIERVERRGSERQRARPKNAEASNAPWTWNQPPSD